MQCTIDSRKIGDKGGAGGRNPPDSGKVSRSGRRPIRCAERSTRPTPANNRASVTARQARFARAIARCARIMRATSRTNFPHPHQARTPDLDPNPANAIDPPEKRRQDDTHMATTTNRQRLNKGAQNLSALTRGPCPRIPAPLGAALTRRSAILSKRDIRGLAAALLLCDSSPTRFVTSLPRPARGRSRSADYARSDSSPG